MRDKSMQFLGFDVSTQSISAVIIDFEKKKIVHYVSLPFDENFPHYHTKSGVIRTKDPSIVHSCPLMWVEALDKILEKLKREIDLSKIKAISGSAQQHGSVYLNKKAFTVLPYLNPAENLRDQLSGIFSRKTSPVWMDSSTREECSEITERIGGKEKLAQSTGSIAFERFTAPQIRRLYKREREKYEETVSICLVSS